MRARLFFALGSALQALLMASIASAGADGTADWPVTEGALGGGRYSSLADIDRGNVASLRVAWTYRHGDVKSGGWLPDRVNRATSFESTPLVVDGRLLFTTPFNRVIALDPESGTELWSFDPEIDRGGFYANMIINRGVAYWRDPGGGPCPRRVFLATLDARLIALDATSGRPCPAFGKQGTVDLIEGLEPMVDPSEYNVTSPPIVVDDVVVVGSSIADLIRRRAPPGDVRAYDARTGEKLWTFHTIPREGEFGAETWHGDSYTQSGAANVWTSMTADAERGLVFLPVSTATPDFYGGDRPGANLFSDSLVAVRARTGKRVWHFQAVHHDLWDYDLASPAVLTTVRRGDRRIDAVALPTKMGFVFVLDRETGEPLFPVEERPVPASDVPGEQASPTQPFPTRPPPLVPQRLDPDDLWAPTERHARRCRKALAKLRNEGLFTPPSLGGSIVYPFTAGGANWSGASFDPSRALLVVPVNNLVHVIRVSHAGDDNRENEKASPMRSYFAALKFLFSGRGTGLRYHVNPLSGRKTLEVSGKPCNPPPWGRLVAVDLDEGTIRWSAPTGRENGIDGIVNFGPPLVTAGGLVFHAGTRELALRAHDVDTGEVLARFELPAGLHAGPISYKLRPGGKQFLVIAPGGHAGLGSKQGDHVIAYTLP
jgi:quinoprotein glucose dehydrogenase